MERWESSKQPCWYCKKAVYGCDWSREFKPIEGWEATYVPAKGDKTDSYDIHFCPEYERG